MSEIKNAADLTPRQQQLLYILTEANRFLQGAFFPGVVYAAAIFDDSRVLQVSIRYEDAKHYLIYVPMAFAQPVQIAAAATLHYLMERNPATAFDDAAQEIEINVISDDTVYTRVRLPGIPDGDEDGNDIPIEPAQAINKARLI
ncbi:MAG: hypothetical protein F9K30_12045 [Dechloromonas sp.]|nr:MAG: hypothetical protein F9K30_12045 [Dechloromonas sp.]